MTIWEWLGTWYFWGPFLLFVIIMVWISYEESKNRQRDICPSCYSDRKKVRYLVHYRLPNNPSAKEPCGDSWHGKYADPY